MIVEFSHRSALVTGGTRGIGAAIAHALLDGGAAVTVTGTSSERPAALAHAFEYLPLDLAQPLDASTRAHVETAGFDICVNNAGINHVADIRDQAPEDVERVLRVNLVGPTVVTGAVGRGMAARGYGRIVNIGSIYGSISRAGRAPYSASKSGVVGLTRAAALDLAPHGVLVNAVCPGFVDTELTRRVLGADGMEAAAATVPLGRLAQVSDIVPVVLFLASSLNSYITGQEVIVDGGHVIR